jgi:protein-S-isoprenylcysteine O-methyltransferase Ste14
VFSPQGLGLFQVMNIWLVMGAIALYQLHLQYNRPQGRRFAEGLPKTLQMISGIPALINLAYFMCDPDLSVPHIESAFNVLGLAIFNVSALLVFWCHVTLGRYWSGELETQPDHKLIDTGPYAVVRHPLYSSYVALGLGLFAMSGSWTVGVSALAYFLAVASRIPKEEAMLEQRLGESYRAYARVTGCVLPRLRARRLEHAATD